MSTYYRSPRHFKQGFRPRRRPTLSPAEHAEIGETLDTIERGLARIIERHDFGSWPHRAALKAVRHVGQLRLRMDLPPVSPPPGELWERPLSAENVYDTFDQCVLGAISGKVFCPVLGCALRCERALWDRKIVADEARPLAVRLADDRPHGPGPVRPDIGHSLNRPACRCEEQTNAPRMSRANTRSAPHSAQGDCRAVAKRSRSPT